MKKENFPVEGIVSTFIRMQRRRKSKQNELKVYIFLESFIKDSGKALK